MDSRIYRWIVFAVLAADSVKYATSSWNEEEAATGNTSMLDGEVTTPARLGNLIDYISNRNDLPSDTNKYFTLYRVIDKTSQFLRKNGYEPYYLDDVLIPGSSARLYRDARCSRVLLQAGRLYGMSDLQSIDGFKMAGELMLQWKHMRATFRVTTDIEGLEDFGDLDVRVGRLLMHVMSPSKFSDAPKVEPSEIRQLNSDLSGLQTASEEVKRAICEEAESRIRSILNGKVRYILLNIVKRTISEDSSDNEILPFRMPDRFFEVRL